MKHSDIESVQKKLMREMAYSRCTGYSEAWLLGWKAAMAASRVHNVPPLGFKEIIDIQRTAIGHTEYCEQFATGVANRLYEQAMEMGLA